MRREEGQGVEQSSAHCAPSEFGRSFTRPWCQLHGCGTDGSLPMREPSADLATVGNLQHSVDEDDSEVCTPAASSW